MKTAAKTALACIAGAVVIHLAWLGFSNTSKNKASDRDLVERSRTLSMEEMEGYLQSGENRKRDHVRLHRGEPTVEGLLIGMSRKEAQQKLAGGTVDTRNQAVMRFPLHTKKGEEVVAKFVGDELCFAAVAPIGSDAASIDLTYRYAEPRGYNGGTR